MLKRKLIDETEVAEDGNRLPDASKRITVTVPLKGRQFERKRGCWNCLHWNCEELAVRHYLSRRQTDAEILARAGSDFQNIDLRLSIQDAAIMPPKTGICLAGGADGEFTFPEVLCTKWSGREVVTGKLDPLADELWDRLGEKQPK